MIKLSSRFNGFTCKSKLDWKHIFWWKCFLNGDHSSGQVYILVLFCCCFHSTEHENVSCFQLTIDRSKPPKNMGKFEDISLFGNFILRVDVECAGGFIASSLTGVGMLQRKPKGNLRNFSENLLWLGQQGHLCHLNYHNAVMIIHLTPLIKLTFQYSIPIISHAPEPIQLPFLHESNRTMTTSLLVFGPKKYSGKRVKGASEGDIASTPITLPQQVTEGSLSGQGTCWRKGCTSS